jgi:hypothetical protein
MSPRNTVLRTLHDIGLAAWFGGSLAGAVAVNGAAAEAPDPALRLRIANTGWARWTPVNAAAIVTHLVGGAGILSANRKRVGAQAGVGASTVAKLVLTAAALGTTAYSGVLGGRLRNAEGVPVEGATDPAPVAPPEVAATQKQLDVCQWAIPALTAALVVLTAVHGEQQRPGQPLAGILGAPGRWLRAAA